MVSIFKSVLKNVLKKKTLLESTSYETKLNRCLSIPQLIFYAISAMAGAGIYVLVGHIIKNKTGPSANISFIIGGISSFFAGLCYCELATLMPQAGSCYTYTYVLIGELPAFIIGWTNIMDVIIILSGVSKSFSSVLNQVTGDVIGNFSRTYLPLTNNSSVIDTSADIIAGSLILLLFLITITGANFSFYVNSVFQSIQLSCLMIVTIAFFVYGSPSNYIANGGYAPFGFEGVIQGAAISIFAYTGFECIANSAEEIKNPKKAIPIAMFSSLALVILLYVFVTSGLSYMVPRLEIDEKSPFVSAFSNKGLDPFKWIATIGALIATGACKLSLTYIIGRVIYALAKDGLLCKSLSMVNKITQVPILAVLVGCIFSIVFAVFVKLEILAEITTMGILLSFIIVGIDLIILRYTYSYSNDKAFLKTRVEIPPKLSNKRSFLIIFISLLVTMFLLEVILVFLLKWNEPVAITFIFIFSILAILLLVMLCLFKPENQENTFQTPLMPLAPVITIAINSGLCLRLSVQTWIRFAIWLIIGIVLYFIHAVWRQIGKSQDEYENLSVTGTINGSHNDSKDEIAEGRM